MGGWVQFDDFELAVASVLFCERASCESWRSLCTTYGRNWHELVETVTEIAALEEIEINAN